MLDRLGAVALTQALNARMGLPEALCLFGADTWLAVRPAASLSEERHRQGRLFGLDLRRHADPSDWDLSGWPVRLVLALLAEAASAHALCSRRWR